MIRKPRKCLLIPQKMIFMCRRYRKSEGLFKGQQPSTFSKLHSLVDFSQTVCSNVCNREAVSDGDGQICYPIRWPIVSNSSALVFFVENIMRRGSGHSAYCVHGHPVCFAIDRHPRGRPCGYRPSGRCYL